MAYFVGSSRNVEEGEAFLNNVVDHWKNIEENYDKDIRVLIELVEDFIKKFEQKRLDGLNQRLYEKAGKILSGLKSRLRFLSSRDEQCKGLQDESLTTADIKSAEKKSQPCVNYQSQKMDEIPMAISDFNSINLVLLGSTGNDKSATGNSITGKNEFKVNSSTSTTTYNSLSKIAKDSAVVGDLSVNVVDGPSINDSGEIDSHFLENIINSVEKALELCDYAFSAILVCLKFGIRFTNQEIKTIKLIKSVLGENVIKDYGICVITHGDNFQHEVEEAAEEGEELTFERWCREQTGDVKSLFEECNFRCVLFDNRTRDEKTKRTQLQTLLKMVDPYKKYSKEEFLKAEDGIKELTSHDLLPELEGGTKNLIDEINLEVQHIDKNIVNDPELYISEMLQLHGKIKTQKDLLQDLGLMSPKLDMFSNELTILQTNIFGKVQHQDVLFQHQKPGFAQSRKEFTSTASALAVEQQAYSFSNTTTTENNYHQAFDVTQFPGYMHGSHQNQHFRENASPKEYDMKSDERINKQNHSGGRVNKLKARIMKRWRKIRARISIAAKTF